MKPAREAKTWTGDAQGHAQITAYSKAQPLAFRTICDLLRGFIDAAIPNATSKIWHGSPVWFIGENPVVGFNATKKSVNMLFWNGQAFGEPALKPVGKYGAAQATFNGADEINSNDVRRWLTKARSDVFDSKAFFQKLRMSKRNDR
jgi:hypothetical protein